MYSSYTVDAEAFFIGYQFEINATQRIALNIIHTIFYGMPILSRLNKQNNHLKYQNDKCFR